MSTEKNQKEIDGLVERSQNGDTNAFGEIYDIFLADIYRFIFYKVTNCEIAEDLTEDAFFKVWKNIKKYKKKEFPFSSWIYRIAHNTVVDYMRKENVFFEEIIEEIHDERMDTSKDTEQYFDQQMLQRALTHLPEMQREAIILKYVNELSNREVAAVLGKTETAVRILLSRAIGKLKEVIERFDDNKR